MSLISIGLAAAVLAVTVIAIPRASADQPPGGELQDFGNTYVLLDSTDAGGPTFNTPAYSPTTVATGLQGQDDASEQVALDFSFTFYGTVYTDVFLSSNGFVSFGAGTDDYEGYADPLATNFYGDVPAAFGYWTDLDPDDNCAVAAATPVTYDTYGAPGSQVFVADWFSCPSDFGNGDLEDYLHFQVRLFEGDNSIEYHYFDVVESEGLNSNGLYTTVGLRGGDDGDAYLQYSFDEAVIDNNMAIRMWHPDCRGLPAEVVGTRDHDTIVSPTAGGVVFAHSGDDNLTGSISDDTLCGADGDDTIDDDSGINWMSGGDGRDDLSGGAGSDTIRGGPGDDTIYGHAGSDDLRGGGGDDTIFGGDGPDEIDGQGGSDIIDGGAGPDVIDGRGAPDVISGGGAADTINGQNGADTIDGGSGSDTLKGQSGPDTINGDAGDDDLLGGRGSDTLTGGPGVDTCAGNTAQDEADGSTCESTPGVEVLF